MVTRVVLGPTKGGWRVLGRFTIKQIKAMRKAGTTLWTLPWTEEIT